MPASFNFPHTGKLLSLSFVLFAGWFANVPIPYTSYPAFALTGYIFWALGLFMAAANFAGGQLGARIALRYGNDFIRAAFYVVVSLLIAKTFKDAYL